MNFTHNGWGQHCFTWFGGVTNFSQAVLLVGGRHYFVKIFGRFARNILCFHGNLPLKSTMLHFVTLMGKSTNLFHSLPPPFNWGTLNITFLLHLWALGALKRFWEQLTFFLHKMVWHFNYFAVLYLTFQHQNLDYSVRRIPLKMLKIFYVFISYFRPF